MQTHTLTAPASSWKGAEGRKKSGATRLSRTKAGTVRPGWFLAPSRNDWMSTEGRGGREGGCEGEGRAGGQEGVRGAARGQVRGTEVMREGGREGGREGAMITKAKRTGHTHDMGSVF